MKKNSILAGFAAMAALTIGAGRTEAAAVSGGNIVEVAVKLNTQGPYAGSFDTLIAAVLAADPVILQTLTGNEIYTVFAPTDSAFAALGLDATNIGTLPQDVLTKILAYHVTPGQVLSQRVVNARKIKMLAGRSVKKRSGTAELVDHLGRTSNIIAVDVPASNGVIHAIDGVLLPFTP